MTPGAEQLREAPTSADDAKLSLAEHIERLRFNLAMGMDATPIGRSIAYVLAALTPSSSVGAEGEWRDLGEAAPGVPVIAQYREWNRPDGDLREHVVWFFNREWRTYPRTDDVAFAERWRPMPAAPRTVSPETGVEP